MDKPKVQISPQERQRRFDLLTKKQVEVLYWRKVGKSDDEIADLLGPPEKPRTVSTVDSHTTAIFDTLLSELPAIPPAIRREWGEFFLKIYYYPILDERFKTEAGLKNYRPPRKIPRDDFSENSGGDSGEDSGYQVPKNPEDTQTFKHITQAEGESQPQGHQASSETIPNNQATVSSTQTPTRRSLRELASDRRIQALVAFLVIAWIIILCIVIWTVSRLPIFQQPTQTTTLSDVVPGVTNDQPTGKSPSTATLPPQPPIETPTITLTPTASFTSTETLTPTPTFTFTPSWTPQPTQEVIVDTDFKDGIGPWMITGSYVIIDGAITSDGRSTTLQIGDTSWVNYKMDVQFALLDTGMCELFMGVRVGDNNEGMWLGVVRAARLGWFKGLRGYSGWISGNEALITDPAPIVTIIVNGDTFNWVDGTSVTVQGFPSGGVQIYNTCHKIEKIKITKLP